MSKRFDELFGEIVAILRRDYAGAELIGDRFDPRYYNTAIGQAWHDERLDELLFLRYIRQMLSCTGDRHLRFRLVPSESYVPSQPGFSTRRYGDSLYVTALSGETRLALGDRITAINGASPARHRQIIQKNFFYADTPEREDWGLLLSMADHIDVERADGTALQLGLQSYPLPEDASPAPTVRELPGARIIDLRKTADLDDDALLELLPLVCREDTPLSALVDSDIFVNYTRLNCLVKSAVLRELDGTEEYLDELREKSGRGYLPESDDDGTVIPGRASGTVLVLTDTETAFGAETLALAAKRAGATLIGRPTLGTIDLCGDVSCALDERYILTWPTAVTRSAREGNGVLGRGVAPDRYIPWTPEEFSRDVVLDAALELCR